MSVWCGYFWPQVDDGVGDICELLRVIARFPEMSTVLSPDHSTSQPPEAAEPYREGITYSFTLMMSMSLQIDSAK